MQKSLLLFPLLFAFSTTTYAGDELLFECVSDKNTHLRLAANQHQNGEITFDFKQAHINQQSEMTFSSSLDEAYLYQYLNGTQLLVPHNNRWYIFEESDATTGIIYVELHIRSQQTGKLVEQHECEENIVSHITEINPEIVRPIPDELFEWLVDATSH